MKLDPLVDRDCVLLDGKCSCHTIAECKHSVRKTEDARHIEAVERERIARMVERADNTMMDQTKLAAYIRGQETP